MLRNWRFWILALLQLGPPAVLVWMGFLWLNERNWGFYGGLAWLVCGTAFGLLVVRWTRNRNPVLPPIDWDAPRTFSPRDRQAWEIVQAEAEQAESAPMESLITADIYIDTGRRLAEKIAAHYHPDSGQPVANVPVVDLLAAFELAAEDLGRLCREVPGGDMVTPSHWKKAVQAANYINKANEIYNYVLPFFQPAAGLMRLGTQKLMMQPAWKNMQRNLLRWFFRAYTNRLGTHLIELYSGRLAIGADQYRRLTGRSPGRRLGEGAGGPANLVIAVAGARDSGKSSLIAALDAARERGLPAVKTRLEQAGFDESLAEHLKTAVFVEVESYTVHDSEVARDRYTRRDAVDEAVESDMLLLVVDGRRADVNPEVKFVESWLEWYAMHGNLEIPPALAVVTGADRPELAGEPEAHEAGIRAVVTRAAREAALKARVESIRRALPPAIADVVPVGLGSGPPTGVEDRLLPEIAALLHRAEKAAMLRHIHEHAARSKARRFFGQVGRQGRRLWDVLRPSRKKSRAGS